MKQGIFGYSAFAVMACFLSTAAFAGSCHVPSGQIDLLEQHDAGLPAYGYVQGDIVQRVEATPGCSSIKLWSYLKANKDGANLKKAPATCKVFVNQDPKDSSHTDWYSCQEIPYYSSLDAATHAGAKAPFAYSNDGVLVVDHGVLFTNQITDFYEQKSHGKVVGSTRYMPVWQYGMGTTNGSGNPAVTDSTRKNTGQGGLMGGVGAYGGVGALGGAPTGADQQH